MGAAQAGVMSRTPSHSSSMPLVQQSTNSWSYRSSEMTTFSQAHAKRRIGPGPQLHP